MGVNFKEAFTYFLQDKTWKYKYVILALVGFVLNLAAVEHIGFITIPFSLFVSGFYILLTHNLINENKPVLPDFDLEKIFINALKYIGAIIIYSMGFVAIVVGLLIIQSLLAVVVRVAGVSVFVPFMLILSILGLVLILGLSIFYLLISLLIRLSFSENLSFKQALDIKRLIKIFNSNLAQYVLLFVLWGVISISTSLIYQNAPIFDNKPVLILTLLVIAFTNTFIAFAFTHLITQAYKQSLAKLENNESKLESLKHKPNNFDYKAIGAMVLISIIFLTAFSSMPVSKDSSLGKMFIQMKQMKYQKHGIHHTHP